MICIKAVAIIPARGGSKGIPRKNIKELCGKPLIGHIIETALEVDELDRVIVSTEDAEIADVAKNFGAEIPFIRSEELARDETPTLPVLQHTVEYLEKEENYYPDIIVLLYPTSPLLSNERISEGIKLISKGKFDSVISVVEDKGHYWIENENGYERLYPKILKNRQLTKPLFKENGAFYIFKREVLMEQNLLVGNSIGFVVMQDKESIDIDEPFDFEMCEILLEKRNVSCNQYSL
ncbi:acylneuraminate cytidylyltransferase family protein [Methanohalophilus profundi]|uniref:acylneuraminate cytidylyltransferase family protein n=1 Tax=Methanohalophilus profundi TaxID=2138083 RepID=UPI0013EA4315|nr:acylneuraminate cytidylyltransferase family protein [Methanohalophilus profundi]